ncbi:MAG: 4Fe-4S binding protein [Desulfovibrionaceae bacterium]
MNAVKQFFRTIADQWSLIVGLGITGKFFCRKLKTVHFPREVVDDSLLDTYAGHVELVGKSKDPETPKCISCGMCVMNCPSGCLKVVKKKLPKPTAEQEQAWKEAEERGEKVVKPKAPKDPLKFLYDYSKCSLCGTCIENCPAGSLRFSHDIYLVWTERKEATLDLLARLKAQAEASPAKSTPAPAQAEATPAPEAKA